MRLSHKRGDKSLKAQRRKTLTRTNTSKAARHRATVTADLQEQLDQRTRELDEALQQQTATSEVLRVISNSPGELQLVFDAMLENATRICAAKFGILYRCAGDALRTVATHGAPQSFVEERQRNPIVSPNPETTLGRALSTRQPVQIADILTEVRDFDDRAAQLPKLAGARSVLAVPMIKGNELLGAILIYRQEVRPFTDKQIELVKIFAAQAAIAIENSRLLNDLQSKTREQQESLEYQIATADVLNVISRSTTNVQPAFDAIAMSAARLFTPCETTITTVHDGQLYWRATASLGRPVEAIERVRSVYPLPFDIENSPSARAIHERRIIEIADATAPGTPENTRRAQSAGEFRSITFVPLLRNGIGIGTIILTHPEAGFKLSPKQLTLVQTFADQAVIAIENARLFDEVQQRTKELSRSLHDLRAAQDRLVQTEKLASLGQLTAGIAHEIKNPLNFVNNFSALSTELIDELEETLIPVPLDQRMRDDLSELTKMLKSNLEKVVQHGKRADSIVKNMLLHSRESSGEHRSADINALVEESLNLAYHGARAEKSGFSITFKRDLDPDAGAAEVYPQEVTRALLNVISNGFYAATKRKSEAGDETFEPVLSATTRSLGNRVEIRIRDNGVGIPPEVREKMFNPFFTTKPAGEGTGLGLSMSHDIIVKQHGGSISVETERGVFTEFIITLPRGDTASDSKPE
jgi:signal transduction histidine kinase